MHWISHTKEEVPILMTDEGPGSEAPITFSKAFYKATLNSSLVPALIGKYNNVWLS